MNTNYQLANILQIFQLSPQIGSKNETPPFMGDLKKEWLIKKMTEFTLKSQKNTMEINLLRSAGVMLMSEGEKRLSRAAGQAYGHMI